MKLKKLLCLLSAAAVISTGAVGCDEKEDADSQESNTDPESAVAVDAQAPEENNAKGQTIYFMSDYDLNPSAGSAKSIPLTIFEEYYGGKIEWIPTTRETMYDDLSKAVLGGQEVDMFPYTDNALPYGVSQDLFEPLDSYIDFTADNWADMKGLADRMAYKGKHYAVPTGINDLNVIVYSRKRIERNDFEDPYKLYKDGKWTWDTFVDMINKCEGYGSTGDIGKGIMQSCGQPYVSYDGNAFSSDLDNEALEKAGKIQERVSGNTYDGSWNDTLSDNSALFLGVGSWGIAQSNKANEDEDVFFVPFPTEDGSGKYVSGDINSKMLVKNSKKGAAVAAYLECERMAQTNEDYAQVLKKAAVDSGMTEEQYDFLQELKNPDNIVFDFSYGFSRDISNIGSHYDKRGAVNNLNDALIIGFKDAPDSWTDLRDKFKGSIEEEMKNY